MLHISRKHKHIFIFTLDIETEPLLVHRFNSKVLKHINEAKDGIDSVTYSFSGHVREGLRI